jgi:uncharacterized repeat protein (TIGR03803 family)
MKKYYSLTVIVCILINSHGSAQYKKLHDFSCPTGCGPEGLLISSGYKLYGMAGGGSDSLGVIFSIDTSGGGYKILHDFKGTDGNDPARATLTLSGNKLFGTTGNGGTNNDGVIFSVDTGGNSYKVLFSFDSVNGQSPDGKLMIFKNKLYGTTPYGGVNNTGVIFSVDTNGNNFKVLFNFNSTVGYDSWASTILVGGTFYGTTNVGGKYNNGTIFSMDTGSSTVTTLYSFGNIATDGGNPAGLLVFSGNELYGVTSAGGTHILGTVFCIHTDGSGYKTLYNFTNYYTSGESPYCPLAINGNKLFGMAQGSDNNCTSVASCGLLFSVDTNGSNYTVLLHFNDTIGDNVTNCGATILGNVVYGVTSNGGLNNDGVIFRYKDSAITTSVNELNTGSETVKVWPNPSNGIFNLQLGIRNLTGKIVIYNSLGQQVYSTSLNLPQGGDFKVDVHTQPTGMYLYRFTSEKGELIGSGKLVVQ